MATNSMYTGYGLSPTLPPQGLTSNPLSFSYGALVRNPNELNARFQAAATHTMGTNVNYPLYFGGNMGPTPQSTLNQIGSQFMPQNPFELAMEPYPGEFAWPLNREPYPGYATAYPIGGNSSPSMDQLFQQYLQETQGGFQSLAMPSGYSPYATPPADIAPMLANPPAPMIGNAQQVIVLMNPMFMNDQPGFPMPRAPIGGGGGIFMNDQPGFPMPRAPIGGGGGIFINDQPGFPMPRPPIGGGFPIGGGGFPIGGGSFPMPRPPIGGGFPIGGGSGFPMPRPPIGGGFPIGGGGFPIGGGGFPIGYWPQPSPRPWPPIDGGGNGGGGSTIRKNKWDQKGFYQINVTNGTNGDDTLKQRGENNFNKATLKDGKDTVKQSGKFNRHEVSTGKGEDVVTVEGERNTSIIKTGDDKDTVTLGGKRNAVALSTEKGNDVITVAGERLIGWVAGGKGDDLITIDGSAKKNKLTLMGGEGHDKIVIEGKKEDWTTNECDDDQWTIFENATTGSKYTISNDIEEIRWSDIEGKAYDVWLADQNSANDITQEPPPPPPPPRDPLVLDLNGNGISLDTTGQTGTRMNDLLGTGNATTQQYSSLNGLDDALLVFDLDKDGIAGEHGGEMFGNRTGYSGISDSGIANYRHTVLDVTTGRQLAQNELSLIQGSESYGDTYANGFDALTDVAIKTLGRSSVSDNVLDASEIQQLNSKIKFGVKINNEYKTLAELGVVQLNLAYTNVHQELNTVGDFIGQQGTFIKESVYRR